MINNLMNNVPFGEKEGFMVSLNSFISSENLSRVESFVEELLVLAALTLDAQQK